MTTAGHRLRSLFWEATLRCNAYCEFCGSRCGDVSCAEPEAADICRTFQQIAGAYDPSGIMINVTGGEPLMRNDLFEIMGFAASLGFPWGMVTNGTLITDAVIEQMRQSRMRTISISLDGLCEEHERSRNLPGQFPVILDAIQKLHQADFLDCIQITTVVTRRNLGQLEEMYRLLSRYPVDSWRLTPVDPIGRADRQDGLLLGKQEMDALFQFMDAHIFSEKPVLTASCSHYLGARDTLYRSHSFICASGSGIASILANGDIYVCPNVPRIPELIQGNIKNDDFVSVWENGFRWFRDAAGRRTGGCENCADWDRCRGDSLHTWDFESGTPKFCIRRMYEPETGDLSLPDEVKESLKQYTDSIRGLRLSYDSSSHRKVFVLPAASSELYHYFHWGENHPANLCEQMAGLIGHRTEDTIFIESIVPMYAESRSVDQAAFTSQSYLQVRSELDVMNANLPDADPKYRIFAEPFQLVGFIHSHPGTLEPEMSAPDLELHNKLRDLSEDFRLTAIINPQRKELRMYWDSVYSPVDVILLMDGSRVGDWA